MSQHPLNNPTPYQSRQQRTAEVFHALDKAAAAGKEGYGELNEFVRLETGTGCSNSLISRWKKERALNNSALNLQPTLEPCAKPPELESTVNNLHLCDEIVPIPSPVAKEHNFLQKSLFRKTSLKIFLFPAAVILLGLAIIGISLPSLSNRPVGSNPPNSPATATAPSAEKKNLPSLNYSPEFGSNLKSFC